MERNTATISYCFLAPFMLLSRQEQFRSLFVRKHAQYATILHAGFIVLIFFFIRSSNFSSTLLFDFSWVHIFFLVLFSILLFLLWRGMYAAFSGKLPRISFKTLKIQNIEKNMSSEVAVTTSEKIPLILTHIPFIGNYFSAKYDQENFTQAEKFGNWLTILLVISLFIDPSRILFAICIILAVGWLVYEAVSSSQKETMTLIGKKLLSWKEVHILLKTTLLYLSHLFKKDNVLKEWNDFYKKSSETYALPPKNPHSAFLSLPVINMIPVFTSYKDTQKTFILIQNILITAFAILIFFLGWLPWILLLILLISWTFFRQLFQRNIDIPVFREITDVIIQWTEWKKTKSKIVETHLTFDKK